MDILLKQANAELFFKNSRFLAEAFPVTTQVEAREKLKSLKELYSDANHVVHAFAVGKNAEVYGMSDDGEPSGTAGRPVLDVLKGKKCTNILVTVTRWFGGTLLGTGGLVKAYSESAKAVLALIETEELVLRVPFSFTVSYDQYELAKRHVQTLNVCDIEEDFAVDISINGMIVEPELQGLHDYVVELTKGKSGVISNN